MKHQFDDLLLRIAVVRVHMREYKDPERPVRRYDRKRDDLAALKGLVTELNAQYSEEIRVLRAKRDQSSPNFETLKDKILKDEEGNYRWDLETRNFYSSVLGTFFSLPKNLKPDEPYLSLKELRVFAQLFLKGKT